ncbi:MAG: tRNA (N6-threonylcarbamoyladenosine(37)-N6)-methyltransferase TrmO [Methanosphaera sp.]|nr:tRNA (N6-threonylcarbamoyladenosine(37)-N6)-methyltransferase TrmO [Methanosphaera sp.]MBR3213252.1 tRNA (N6-threonylcarbamoyladenosine(37)-N6)-methyltransferase TrmO [Methanosphaera sp.]
MKEIIFKQIGYIKSPFDDVEDVPKRVSDAMDVEGELVVYEEYLESMADMKVDEEYMVIFYLDKCEGFKQTVPLRGDGPLTALFSTRAPCRPNPIGVSNIIVKKIDGNVVKFNGVDMLNNTPILDIKKVF